MSRSYRLPVAAAMLLACVNGAIGISTLSYARDEGFSVSTALRSWSSLADLLVSTETNGWPYSVLLRAWSAVGIDPGTLRIPSLIAFVLTVPVAAWIANTLFGRRPAIITAFGIALNGSLLMYAQQIRSYALAVLFATIATALFVADVRRPRWGLWAGWVLALWLTAACQLQMLTLAVAHLVAVFALPREQRLWLRRLGGAALAVVLSLPAAVAILSHEEGQDLLGWRPGVFKDILLTFTGHDLIFGTFAFGAGGLFVLRRLFSATKPPASPEPRFGLALTVSWAIVPFACMFVVSFVQPTLIGRYLLFCVPAIVIALALLIDHLVDVSAADGRRPLAMVAAVALAGGATSGSLNWHLNSGTEHWNEATAYVFANAEPTDQLIVANDSVRLFFEYERRLLARTATPPGPQPGYPANPWGEYQTGDQSYRSPSGAAVDEIAGAAPRIWVVWGRDHVDTEVMPERLARLQVDGLHQVRHETFPGQLEVYLFER